MTRHPGARLLLPLLLSLLPSCRGERGPAPRVEMYLAKAEQLARHSMLSEAIIEVEKAVATDPDWPATQLMLGRLLRRVGVESGAGRDDRKGYYARARAALERAIELEPSNVQARIELGQLQADSNRGREAIRLLEPVANDDHPEAQFHLASILAGLGEFARARELYRAGLERRPDDARAHIAYGVALERSGELEQARDQYQRAVRLAPESTEAFYRLGSVLAKLGPAERAVLALARATELDPQSEDALYALAMAQRRNDQAEIAKRTEERFAELRDRRERVTALEERLARDPGDLDVRSELAEGYSRRGQTLRALAGAKKVLEGRPADTRAHRVLAECHRRLGAIELALLQADRTVQLSPSDAAAVELRGELRFETGDMAGAATDFSRALALGRKTGVVFDHLARIELAAGRPEPALALALQGAEAAPTHTPVFRTAAEALIALHRREAAGQILLRVLAHRPADIEALRELLKLAEVGGTPELQRHFRDQIDFVAPPSGAAR